jgi:hypothetical protein
MKHLLLESVAEVDNDVVRTAWDGCLRGDFLSAIFKTTISVFQRVTLKESIDIEFAERAINISLISDKD